MKDSMKMHFDFVGVCLFVLWWLEYMVSRGMNSLERYVGSFCWKAKVIWVAFHEQEITELKLHMTVTISLAA